MTTVTKLKSDWREKSSQYQIASNASYIAYGLRQGHIRLLSKETASPALLKGHTAMVRPPRGCREGRRRGGQAATPTLRMARGAGPTSSSWGAAAGGCGRHQRLS